MGNPERALFHTGTVQLRFLGQEKNISSVGCVLILSDLWHRTLPKA